MENQTTSVQNIQHANRIFENFITYIKTVAKEVRKTPTSQLFFSKTAIPVMNLILPKSDEPSVLKEALSEFKDTPCAWIDRGLSPTNIDAQYLSELGFNHIEHCTSMICELGSYLPQSIKDGLTFVLVEQRDQFERWVKPVSCAFELSQELADQYREALMEYKGPIVIEHYLVQLYGKDVGACSLVISGDVAGFYNLAVEKNSRNQGVGSAIQNFRLTRAKELGLKYAILQASKMAENLDKHSGFHSKEKITIYCKV